MGSIVRRVIPFGQPIITRKPLRSAAMLALVYLDEQRTVLLNLHCQCDRVGTPLRETADARGDHALSTVETIMDALAGALQE